MALLMQSPRPPGPPIATPRNASVSNSVRVQNWCEDSGGKGVSGENLNLPNNTDFAESKKYGPSRTVIVLIALSWLVSITALLLTAMVIFGKIGSPCGCSGTQGKRNKIAVLVVFVLTDFLINFLGVQLWLFVFCSWFCFVFLRKISTKLKNQKMKLLHS